MPEKVLTIVRIPIAEIEDSLRVKHVLPKVLTDVRIEDNALTLYFSDESESGEVASPSSYNIVQRKRRARRRRNRMKTRGWQVVARIANSKGQKCAIYKPFTDVLNDPKLTLEEQKKLVEKILKANRNRPSDGSVQYFLENTLEYLQKTNAQNATSVLKR